MTIKERKKLLKEVDKLKKKRDKSINTFEIVKLAIKINKLKKKLGSL